MTEGPIARQLIAFALPLMIGHLFQQLYNTADALIVGKFVSTGALAAVTASGPVIHLLISLFEGTASGAGMVIARYFGARDHEKLEKAIHTTVFGAMIVGVFLTVFGALFTPTLLRWMSTPDDVMRECVLYLRVYFFGAMGLVLFNAGMGIMQALGDSTHPLRYLIVSACTNVVLDLVFIIPLRMGVTGAALATSLSQLLAGGLCIGRLIRTEEEYRLNVHKLAIDGPVLRMIIKYGIPAGMQDAFIGIANVVVQSNVNYFGSLAMAGCGASSKVEGFAFIPITCFCMALGTFVSQNMGAGENGRVRKGAAIGLGTCVALAEAIGVIVYLTAPILIALFTDDPEAVAFGIQKSRIAGPFYFALAATHVMASIDRGMGKPIVPMATYIIVWCVIRVSILKIAVPMTQSITTVNWVYPITWGISTTFLLFYTFLNLRKLGKE